MVVLLSGGTGGAKLARGLADVADLVVVANTADDTEVYGVHVSPDPDLVAYWLADVIDERGFGIRGDTWAVMDALAAAGHETWFRLGDRDLAMCLLRTEGLRAGERLTEAHAAVTRALGLSTPVLPMCDEDVRTRVGDRGLQEFLIVDRGAAPIESVTLAGVESARPTPDVLESLAAAEVIVIGPSNPVISIGPILAVPGMREALREASAPVVAVSPFVGGEVLKGPTDAFCRHAGIEPTAQGIAEAYSGVIDGIVADEPVEGIPALETDTLMSDLEGSRRLARTTLEFAATLAR